MLNAQVIKVYKELRKPYFYTGSCVVTQLKANNALKTAIYQEKVNRLWDEYEDDRVRLLIQPDNDADLEFLEGDCFNPEVNKINPETLKRQEKEFIDKINRDGVWGIVSEVKCLCCGEWTQADSCWGFVGDDWKESGCDLDVKAAALEKAGLWEA
jgi:hypothetical protein